MRKERREVPPPSRAAAETGKVQFRQFLKKLSEYGELVEIEREVDWNLEAAAILAMSYRVEGPAVLFKKIRGYPPGYSLVGGLYAGKRRQPWRKMAIALGLSPDLSYEEWVKEFTARLDHPIKPLIVSTGACKEEIHVGEEVDVFEFPLPYIHFGDGGRYGGTLPITITRHPYRNWVNIGNYRWMAHDRDKLGGDFQPGQHMADMYAEYERQGKPMPFCMALGVNPALDLAAAIPLDVGVNEAEIAGGLQGEPIQMVRAETNDLLVPADAEIVIEGAVYPGERLEEGPFGEYDGFMTTRLPQPVYRIHAITHRRDPILPMVGEGFRFNDTGSMAAAILAPLLGKRLEREGFPGLKFYNVAEASWAWPVVAVPRQLRERLGALISAVWSIPHMGWLDKLMLVDEDVDITDSAEILEVLGTRVRPSRVYQSKTNKPISFIAAWATADELRRGLAACLTYDCTTHRDEEPPVRIELEGLLDGQTLSWLQQRWASLGLAESLVLKK